MYDNPYNKLPNYIKQKYKIVYSELLCDNITMFKNKDEKWGVISSDKKFGLFNFYDFLVKPIYNSVAFNKELKLIIAVEYENNVWNQDKNTSIFFDLKGKIIWKSEKGESVHFDNLGNILLNRANKIGLLNNDFKQSTEPIYQRLNALNNSFYKAFKDGKYGIINSDDLCVLDFEFDEIFNVVEKNKVIIKKSKNYYTFDFDNNSLKELPFSKILNASSNTYKAPSNESFKYHKSIINLKENTDYYDYNFEMIKYQGKWGIINGAGDVIIPNDYSFVDFLRNPKYFKVGIGEIEVIDYEDDEENYITSIKNVKWGIVDINNEIIVPIEYDWIDEVESTVWVVYKGGIVFYNDDYQEDYWTIKNAKLGVYNLQKLITPIEYDSIKTTWFRIKDYIFVQKGINYFDENKTEYDVFTLDGKKIEKNKPNPKNHNNNG